MKRDILFDDYAKSLEGEYKENYDRIHIYIESSIPQGSDISIIMNEVVDLLLSAQQDQRRIHDVIGEDFTVFCDQLIEAHHSSLTERVFNFLNFYRFFALIAFLFEGFGLVADYMDGVKDPWLLSVSTGGFVIAILLSFSVFSLFKIFSKYAIAHLNWYNKKIDSIITGILAVGVFIGIIFFPEQIYDLVPIPRWFFIPLMLFIFIITTIRKRKEKKQDIKDGNYIPFDYCMVDENIKQYRKKYEKYCQKCARKNMESKNVQTWYEDFYTKDMRYEKFGQCIFVLMVICFVVGGFMTSELIDGLVFAIIIIVVETLMYRFLDKGRQSRVELYKIIHEKNTDIYDDSLFTELETL